MVNKENEQPQLGSNFGQNISTGTYDNMSSNLHGGDHQNEKQFQTFQGGMTKQQNIMSGQIHAPRHSFTKRSFGRDLSNLQQSNLTTADSFAKQAYHPNKVQIQSFHIITQSNLKTRSVLGQQQSISNQSAIQNNQSLFQPQILSQANTATNSLAKMKTIGDLKQTIGAVSTQNQDMKSLTSMMQNMAMNTIQNGSSHRQMSSNNRVFERKTITCLSQERTSATVANSTRSNLSFGGIATSIHQNQNNNNTSHMSIIQANLSSQLAQQLQLNSNRAQSAINTYGAKGIQNQPNIPTTIDSKGRKLKKFQRLQELYYSTQLDPVDQPNTRDPQSCAEYAIDIYEFLRETECENIAIPGYMEKQEDINEKMRGILIDWLIEVHLKFKLIPESLYLTVNLIDRYLEKEQVNRQKLQLVGVTAMLIACKYEEIYPPIVKDFVYITDNAYSKEEILTMERKMLQTLDFNIQITSANRFLERYTKVAGGDSLIFNLSKYLIELSLVSYKMLKYTNSNLAASSLYLSLKMTKHPNPWTDQLVHHTQYKEQTIRQCAKDLFLLLQEAQQSSLQAVKKKFSHPKYGEVSKIRLEQTNSQTSSQSSQQHQKNSKSQLPAGNSERDHILKLQQQQLMTIQSEGQQRQTIQVDQQSYDADFECQNNQVD